MRQNHQSVSSESFQTSVGISEVHWNIVSKTVTAANGFHEYQVSIYRKFTFVYHLLLFLLFQGHTKVYPSYWPFFSRKKLQTWKSWGVVIIKVHINLFLQFWNDLLTSIGENELSKESFNFFIWLTNRILVVSQSSFLHNCQITANYIDNCW